MINFLKKKLNPTCYQGINNHSQHFEGWYFKIIDKNERQLYAIIPGVFIDKNKFDSHSFIQIFNGVNNKSYYYKFPIKDFLSKDYVFNIQINSNYFSSNKLVLDLKNSFFEIHGELHFTDLTLWPKTLIEPGIMGWYTWAPFMEPSRPGFLKMVRAPFLSSIISPLIAGKLFACYITGSFDIFNFIIVFIMGICLHIATNVYNDIYDTIQGTDQININRNEFSGGSGLLVDYPNLLPVMYRIARFGLAGALIATIVLLFQIYDTIQICLIVLFLLSAFFSKYYTAAPIKLAYRGWGEISVWFAFGPMAILVAAVSQNVGFYKIICVAMPITGISTLSIVLIGQMIDLEADKSTGKWGVAVRLGNKSNYK